MKPAYGMEMVRSSSAEVMQRFKFCLRLYLRDAKDPVIDSLWRRDYYPAIDEITRTRGPATKENLSRVMSEKYLDRFKQLVVQIRLNRFIADRSSSILSEQPPVDGTLFFDQGCKINHSCTPNCRWTIIKGILGVETEQNICKGEEITISYPTIMVSWHWRTKQTGGGPCYGTICFCAPAKGARQKTQP